MALVRDPLVDLNSIRDILLVNDNSPLEAYRKIYTVPSIFDLYITKMTTFLITNPNDSLHDGVVEILNLPPGEATAIFMAAGDGYAEQDWTPRPIVVPPLTEFYLDIRNVSDSEIVYHLRS
jgi:hypothetical protein